MIKTGQCYLTSPFFMAHAGIQTRRRKSKITFLSMCWKVRDTFSHFVSGRTKPAPFPTQQNSLLPLKIFPSVFPWDILPPSLPSTLLRIYNIPPPPLRYFSTLASSYHSVRFMALCQKTGGDGAVLLESTISHISKKIREGVEEDAFSLSNIRESER